MGRGEWYRYSKKKTTEDVPQLDIRRLNRRSFIPGSIAIVMWNNGWHLQYRAEERRLVLTSHNQAITLTSTKCHYGGERRWFSCPGCAKRVAVLYEIGRLFHCRHCHSLPYATQQENDGDRLLRKARNIRRRLGASLSLADPIPKPKGMHWRTYYHRLREEREANQKVTLAMGAAMGLLGL